MKISCKIGLHLGGCNNPIRRRPSTWIISEPTKTDNWFLNNQQNFSKSLPVCLVSITQKPSLGKQHPEEQFTAFREVLTCRKVNAGVNAENGCISTVILTSHSGMPPLETREKERSKDDFCGIQWRMPLFSCSPFPLVSGIIILATLNFPMHGLLPEGMTREKYTYENL